MNTGMCRSQSSIGCYRGPNNWFIRYSKSIAFGDKQLEPGLLASLTKGFLYVDG